MSSGGGDLCTTCGFNESEHDDIFTDNAVTVATVQLIAAQLPEDLAKVLNTVITDWRTHTLPTCDPLAIN
jgi:hypothetical protein